MLGVLLLPEPAVYNDPLGIDDVVERHDSCLVPKALVHHPCGGLGRIEDARQCHAVVSQEGVGIRLSSVQLKPRIARPSSWYV